MPTARADVRSRVATTARTTALSTGRAAGLALLALGVAACGSPGRTTPPPPADPVVAPAAPATSTAAPVPPGSPGPSGPSGVTGVVPADVATTLQGVLDARATAVLTRDRAGFDAGLGADADLRASEDRYFASITQLPLSRFSYRLAPESLVRTGDGYWGVVEVTTRLGAFDQHAVRTLDRFRFAPDGARFVVDSTTDPAWEDAHLGLREPWETGAVTAVRTGNVLGVLDAGTAGRGPELVATVAAGVDDVAARVPYAWPRTVVFYALSDPAFLAGLEEVPGGDPQALDAVAITVPVGPEAGDDAIASTRFALNGSALDRLGPRRSADLARLVRHELTHVAVGTHDDEAPVWLSEGVAEWLSVQALAPGERRVPARTLAAARAGTLRLPAEDAFNDEDAAEHYALAWWMVEWVARARGEQGVWALLDAFTAEPGQDDARVVRQVLRVPLAEVARRGADLMARTYAPVVTEPTDGAPPTGPATSPPPTGP
ncbi:hypothetical protein FE634_11200 [Nocardioides dongxiaopingii]|uniref:hypothetical protein n=1 Tax=Nocardioides sp. S-1144 TaxID=2582905 RepID=UPI00110F4018|nr:hypothetical protein [Nocardioides sp. S-1144]QCW50829.1 hypothetical protein FE634_11200 [Nocardioides sp. S-1144]